MNDKSSGLGTYTWANGGKWTGNFDNGTMNGTGNYTDANGNNMQVTYKNGKYSK